MSLRASKKKYVVAIDLDYTALISNDLGGLRSAVDMDALSDADALDLVARLTNPRLLEAVKTMRARGLVDRIVFYTAKGGIIRDLQAPPDLWITDRTLRFRAGPASRTYLYDQLRAGGAEGRRADLVGLGVLTWALSHHLGLRELSAPVYIVNDAPKDPTLIAHDLAVEHVVLFDDQAPRYAEELAAQYGVASDVGLRAVAPFDYECLTPAQAQGLEAFLYARCGPPRIDCDVAEASEWRIAARARGVPMPPWLIDGL